MVTTTAVVRDEMLNSHYPLARKIACRMYEELPKTLDVDDLIHEAVLGLIEAIDRFDAERGVPFQNYARYRIRGAVVDAVRGEDWMPQSVRRKGKRLERARRHLASRLGREPSREELAAQLGLDVEELHTLQDKAAVPQVLSLDAPATDDGSLLCELVPSADDCFQIVETREVAV